MIQRALLIAALLPLAACASTAVPNPTGPAPVADSRYQAMTCDQMAAASKSTDSDLAWARRQQQETFSGDTSSNVSFSLPIGGSGVSAGSDSSGAGPRVGALKAEQAGLRDAMAAKGCN